MSAAGLLRWALDLPPRRHRSISADTQWVAMADGVRLATTVWRPTGVERAPAVLLRTPYGSRRLATPMFLLARIFAEAGHAAVVQDVRGRYASEGEFTPFVNEAADGASCVRWAAEQSWCNGSVGLVGFSYLAYAAWAAQAACPEPVKAVAVGIGASNLHDTFYPGGAFSLETALRWAAGVGERENLPERRVDFERAVRHRPIRQADRVAIRQRDFYRDWLDHPRLDAYWQAFRPDVRRAPATLLVAGWWDFFLGPQLADHAALAASADAGATRLVLGPWSHGRYVRRTWSPRTRWFGRAAVLEMLRFLDRELLGIDDGAAPALRMLPVSCAGPEERWLDADAWPPPDVRAQRLHLRAGARLDPEPPGAEDPTRFTYDPEDPAPSCGGALIGPGGPMDQRGVEARADVLTFTEPAAHGRARLIAGPARCILHAASSAPDTDFTAKLVDVAPDGTAINLAEGIVRCRWRDGGDEPSWLEPDVPVRLEIDLWAVGARVSAGHRLRVEISSSSFPRYDRNPNTRDDPATAEKSTPARQTIFHDAERPSNVEIHVRET